MEGFVDGLLLSNIQWGQIIIRVVFAVIVGMAIGFEREISNHPAGLKTHALVCLGAAVTSMIAQEMVMQYGANQLISDASKIDVSRIASGVVSGIGFIGAGAIIKSKDGVAVTGITTAATIWISGCMGLAIGMGYFRIAAVAFVGTLISTTLLKYLEGKFIKTRGIKHITLIITHKSKTLRIIEDLFIKKQITVTSFKCVEFTKDDGKYYRCIYSLRNPKTVPMVSVINELAKMENVVSVFERQGNKDLKIEKGE